MSARQSHSEAGPITEIRAPSKRLLNGSSMGSISELYGPRATRFPSGEPTVETLSRFFRPDDLLCGRMAGGLCPLVDLSGRAEARPGPTLV